MPSASESQSLQLANSKLVLLSTRNVKSPEMCDIKQHNIRFQAVLVTFCCQHSCWVSNLNVNLALTKNSWFSPLKCRWIKVMSLAAQCRLCLLWQDLEMLGPMQSIALLLNKACIAILCVDFKRKNNYILPFFQLEVTSGDTSGMQILVLLIHQLL